MHYFESVEIVEAAEELFEYAPDYALVEMLPGLDEIDDRTPFTKLSHNLVGSIPFKHFIQLDNIGVIQFLK